MVPRDVKCSVCGRCRRESDKARHKCTTERQKPVQEQEGAVSRMLDVWSLLKCLGGLAVHRCARQVEGGQTVRPTVEDQTTESLAPG